MTNVHVFQLKMHLSAGGARLAVLVLLALISVQGQGVQAGKHNADMTAVLHSMDTTDTRTVERREKRQIPKIGIGLNKGVKALRNLIAHSEKGGVTGNTARYTKLGDLETAVDDFYSLKPRDIRTPNMDSYTSKGMVLFGRIGDYRVRLFERGSRDGRYPVLEFTNSQIRPSVHKILYKAEYRIYKN